MCCCARVCSRSRSANPAPSNRGSQRSALEAEGTSHDIVGDIRRANRSFLRTYAVNIPAEFSSSRVTCFTSAARGLNLASPNRPPFLGRSFGGAKWLPSQGFSLAGFLQLRVMSKPSRLWLCFLEQAWSCRCFWRRTGWISASDFGDRHKHRSGFCSRSP